MLQSPSDTKNKGTKIVKGICRMVNNFQPQVLAPCSGPSMAPTEAWLIEYIIKHSAGPTMRL